MKFEKYVFGTMLHGWSVAKYTDTHSERVTIVAEHSDHDSAGELTFQNNDEYEAWIDDIVDSETQVYHSALAVDLLLDALTDN